jgi:hypothetical protein
MSHSDLLLWDIMTRTRSSGSSPRRDPEDSQNPGAIFCAQMTSISLSEDFQNAGMDFFVHE